MKMQNNSAALFSFGPNFEAFRFDGFVKQFINLAFFGGWGWVELAIHGGLVKRK